MPVTISGIQSVSSILVPQGGTGNSNLPSGSLLVGNNTSPVAMIPPGSEGQVLTVVNGEWSAANAVTGSGGGGLSTVNTTGNITGDGSAGSPVALASNISLTSVSASFSGSGAKLSNIPNAALQNSSITINGESVSLGGTINIVTTTGGGGFSIDYTTVTFTANGLSAGNLVAFSGSLVKADYSDSLRSNVIGIVDSVSGTDVSVRMCGQITATSASSYPTLGTPVYVGPSGSVVSYSQIPSGKFVTQVGFIAPSGSVIFQPRVFGQLA